MPHSRAWLEDSRQQKAVKREEEGAGWTIRNGIFFFGGGGRKHIPPLGSHNKEHPKRKSPDKYQVPRVWAKKTLRESGLGVRGGESPEIQNGVRRKMEVLMGKEELSLLETCKVRVTLISPASWNSCEESTL